LIGFNGRAADVVSVEARRVVLEPEVSAWPHKGYETIKIATRAIARNITRVILSFSPGCWKFAANILSVSTNALLLKRSMVTGFGDRVLFKFMARWLSLKRLIELSSLFFVIAVAAIKFDEFALPLADRRRSWPGGSSITHGLGNVFSHLQVRQALAYWRFGNRTDVEELKLRLGVPT